MQNNDLIKVLERIGLTQKEAQVYLAALEGTATIAELAKRAQLKRPTVYLLVDTLKEKGLVSESKQGTKIYYTAAKPSTLKEKALANLSALESSVPVLEQINATQIGRPKVELFEGRQGIASIYKELLQQKEILFVSNIGEVVNNYPEELIALWKATQAGTTKVREIVGDNYDGRKYARDIKTQKFKNHDIKIARNHVLYGDTFLSGNIIGMVSLKENNLFVIRIENEDLAKSFRALFELAWTSAKPPKLRIT